MLPITPYFCAIALQRAHFLSRGSLRTLLPLRTRIPLQEEHRDSQAADGGHMRRTLNTAGNLALARRTILLHRV